MSIATTEQTVPTGTWQVDAAHSQVGFAVDYMVGTFRGSFSPVEATLADGVLTGSARAENIKVQDENLTSHLLTPEFFDVERAPEIAFVSSDLRSGELTINGITQPVELASTVSGPLTDGYGRERIGLKLETTIDRTEFGLNWNLALPSGEPALANDVVITAELYLVRA